MRAKLQAKLNDERTMTMVRWWIVGIVFSILTIPALYLMHDQLGMPLTIATLLVSEILTVLRFGVNDRWVFGNLRPTWRRLIEYHAAVITSTLIWWAMTNALPMFGIHYLIASVLGTVVSVMWSMVTNFLWVWKPKPPAVVPAILEAAAQPAAYAGSVRLDEVM
ncbi:MAG: GtrA family protein [Chloroflexi bacterium]|nr:GtrA family protein [Chloroflexota bacterium]